MLTEEYIGFLTSMYVPGPGFWSSVGLRMARSWELLKGADCVADAMISVRDCTVLQTDAGVRSVRVVCARTRNHRRFRTGVHAFLFVSHHEREHVQNDHSTL